MSVVSRMQKFINNAFWFLMICLIYGSYIDGSENLSGSTQNALFEIMHFEEKRTKKFCRVRPAMGNAG